MRKTLLLTALAALGATGMAQTRNFYYNGDPDGTGHFYWLSDNGTGAWGNTIYSDLYETTVTATTKVNVKSYVYVSGDFNANYTVTGYGAGSESASEVDPATVTVLTNRDLYAIPGYFTSVQDPNTGVTYGHIDFQLYFTDGPAPFGPVPVGTGAHWTDNNGGSAINPAQLDLTAVYAGVIGGSLPDPNGVFGLTLTRHLYDLSSFAKGNYQYVSQGEITIAVY
jgi:hypothetical protein